MALWFVAVILLVAAGLMPSEARAHGDHPRASTTVATTALAGARTPSEARPLVFKALTVQAMLASSCDGACCNTGCRTSGSCCTGTGLAPESADHAGPRGPGEPALARALPARTDVVPEALPEPPRLFA